METKNDNNKQSDSISLVTMQSEKQVDFEYLFVDAFVFRLFIFEVESSLS